MTPHRFIIQGARGIRAGMGRDAITVDLDSLVPDDAKQVAITGDNGSGKSTIMTLGLNPWREPNGVHGSIYDQFGDAGKRELEWSHNGKRYRSVMEYRNGKTKSQKATLLALDDAGSWQPVSLPDNTVSDGKSRTYDACLRHILGPQELYYICASRTQGAPKIAEHDEAKDLLRALLDLDYVDALHDRAKGVRREVTRRRDELRESAREIDEIPVQIAAAKSEVAAVDGSMPGLVNAVSAANDGVAVAKAEHEAVVAQDYARLDLVRRRQEAEQRVNDVRNEWRGKWAAAKGALDGAKAAEAAAAADHQSALAVVDGDIASVKSEIAAHQDVLTKREAVERAQARIVELERAAEVVGLSLEEAASIEAEANRIGSEHAVAKAEAGALEQRVDALKEKIAEHENTASYVDRVFCGGKGEYAQCIALKDAIASREAIPGLHADRDKEAKACSQAKARAEKLGEQHAKLREQIKPDERDALKARLAGIKADLGDAHRTAELRHRLEAAQEAIAAAQARLNGLHARRVEADEAGRRRTADAAGAVAEAVYVVDEIKAQGQAAVAKAQEALDAIPQPGSTDALDKAKAALATAEAAVQDAQDAVAQAQARRASLNERIAALADELHRGQAVAARIAALDDEVAVWDLLARGLQGVVDLSIEAAGPSVAAIANDMLTRTFGGRFALRVVTQKEQANGRTVETFDISVLDSETDSEASILHKSGGESVWLDAALSMAVALYQQDVAGRRYETRFADEADDGLAADRKRMYYKMSREAMDLGGYGREFFVSHHPDAAVWADAVVDVSRLAGGAQ